MSKKITPAKKPPKDPIKSSQLDLNHCDTFNDDDSFGDNLDLFKNEGEPGKEVFETSCYINLPNNDFAIINQVAVKLTNYFEEPVNCNEALHWIINKYEKREKEGFLNAKKK